MAKTLMGYERIKRLHEAGDHSRCKFGCSPENPEPNQDLEFMVGQIESSHALADKLGRNDPRVAVALDARAYLDAHRRLKGGLRGELECIAAMVDCLIAEEPDRLDLLQVGIARRLLDSL
jgi:hypothetical protein